MNENTLVRFMLCNDVFGEPILSNEEFYEFENLFYNKDLSGARKLKLWELVDLINDNEKAERVYLALQKNYDNFLRNLKRDSIKILTEKDDDYPVRLKQKLKKQAPVLLYSVGDTRLLNKPSSAVTGSRKMSEKGQKFAFDIGETIALENKVIISGGANGCDKNATENAIKNGGNAVWFCAVPLSQMLRDKTILNWIEDKKICLCSDFNPYGKFEGKIALRRNRYIYANAETAFVCQCNSKISGTYSGALFSLKNDLCELFVYGNGLDASELLIKNGAIAIVDK